MARAKCQWCKREVDTKTAHKEVINGKNKYWCNDDCYKTYEESRKKQAKLKAEYDEIYEISNKIFGYTIGSYPLLKSQIEELEKTATRQKIIQYLKGEEEFLSKVMKKDFDDEFCRIKYFRAVIASKIHDYKPKVEIKRHEKTIEICGVGPSNYKPREARRGLDFLEE